ncbi:HAD hydrolase-like protein [Streptomyces sp. NPDC060064]|uniref:HAD hydrolase-like protein n=1 Tax=Streptomyces sp. NPDC060064 TaxID=3347049 RepID=UPI0036A41323
MRAAHDADVDIGTAWMVSDHDTDMAAARAAGCRLAVHVTRGGSRNRASSRTSGSTACTPSFACSAASRRNRRNQQSRFGANHESWSPD